MGRGAKAASTTARDAADLAEQGDAASLWELRAERFAFLGNSLLAPMAADAAVGLDEAFWGGFAAGEPESPSVARALGRLGNRALAARAGGAPLADAVRRVNVEYARLFIGPPSPAAPPWETMYAQPGKVGEIGFGRATVAMQGLLAEAGLALAGESNQYADHLGIELLYLSELCRRRATAADGADAEGRLRAFAREHPGTWAPTFRDQVAAAAPDGYYAPLADLAVALLEAL